MMVGALLLLGPAGCGDPGDGGGFGVVVGATTGGVGGTTGASTDASSSVGDEYVPCEEHGDCEGLSCFDGVCLPCEGREDRCGDDELCIGDRCRALVELDACQSAGVATCGDGILQAPELCDGGSECEGCERTVNEQPWGDPVEADALDVAPDGTVAALSSSTNGTRLHLFGPNGSTRRVRLLDPPMRGLRWVAGQLFLWGADVDSGAVVLGVDANGDELWRTSFPRAHLGGGRAFDDGLVFAGSVEHDHSAQDRGLVVALGPGGEVLMEAKQGDQRLVSTVAAVDDEFVVTGRSLDHENRNFIRRLDASGASRWTDAGFWWTFSPVMVVAQGSDSWSIASDGTAVLHDAQGQRVQTVPCLGSVDGSVDVAVSGDSPALAFAARIPAQDPLWWVLAGEPTEAPRAWATPHEVQAMAWMPTGSLLVALDGVPTLLEVSL